VGNLDEFEGGLMHRAFEVLVTAPVAIGLFDHDIPLEEESFKDLVDVELGIVGIAYSQGDVLKITKQGHVFGLGWMGHRDVSCN
jgi:hypothetical protein